MKATEIIISGKDIKAVELLEQLAKKLGLTIANSKESKIPMKEKMGKNYIS